MLVWQTSQVSSQDLYFLFIFTKQTLLSDTDNPWSVYVPRESCCELIVFKILICKAILTGPIPWWRNIFSCTDFSTLTHLSTNNSSLWWKETISIFPVSVFLVNNNVVYLHYLTWGIQHDHSELFPSTPLSWKIHPQESGSTNWVQKATYIKEVWDSSIQSS